MLIVEENSVYEIDEECLKHKKVPPECGVYEKIRQARQKEEQREEKKHPVCRET